MSAPSTQATRPISPATSRDRTVAARLLRWGKDRWLAIVVVIALLFLVGVPLYFSIDMSFRDGTPANPGNLTLDNYERVYGNDQTASALINTAVYAIGVSAISLTLAVFFAWLIERTDMPGRNFAWVVMLLPIAIPGMLSSMAWVLMLSSKVGILNIAIRNVLDLFGVHLTSGPFNIYNFGSLIVVEGIRGSTALFLIVVGAFRLMDPALEEAASVSGASTFYTFRKVTLKLMAPAILVAGMYALIGNLDDLEGPLIIGLPAGIFLLPTLIYFTASRNGDWGLASAYTTVFLVITVVMVVIYYVMVLRNAGKFTTITGKAYRPRRSGLGRWRYPALGVFVLYFIVTIALPVLTLLWASLLPIYEPPSTEALSHLTLHNYVDLWGRPGIMGSTVRTLLLGMVAATATMILSFLVAWVVARQQVRGAAAVDALAFVPHAIPTVAVAIAMVAFYLSPTMRWTHLYGTIFLMALALMTRYITFGTRTGSAAMSQLSKELEEVAHTSGVGKIRTLTRITFRLLMPVFLAGWIFVAAHSMRNLTIPLMLSSDFQGTLPSTLYFYWYRESNFSAAATLGVVMIAGLAILAVGARRIMSTGYTGADQ